MTNQPKQKTPLQKVIEELKRKQSFFDKGTTEYVCYGLSIMECESHLPEERQAIIDAHEEGVGLESLKGIGEDFFNETYESHE